MTLKLLVVGGAKTVWEDLCVAHSLGPYDAVAVVNDIGIYYEDRIDIWCTLHPENMRKWKPQRIAAGFNTDFVTYAHSRVENREYIDKEVEYRFYGMTSSGSSGLFAVKIGLDEGFDRVVLAGVPMQKEAAHFFSKDQWSDHQSFTGAWRLVAPKIRDRVKSVSGWTRELLGFPTTEWLRGTQPGR